MNTFFFVCKDYKLQKKPYKISLSQTKFCFEDSYLKKKEANWTIKGPRKLIKKNWLKSPINQGFSGQISLVRTDLEEPYNKNQLSKVHLSSVTTLSQNCV